MNFNGNLMTTGMGILPHRDIGKALDLAFRLDVPFWPQLPHIHYYEDMYVQFSENFPGIQIDLPQKRISLIKTDFTKNIHFFTSKKITPSYILYLQNTPECFIHFCQRILANILPFVDKLSVQYLSD